MNLTVDRDGIISRITVLGEVDADSGYSRYLAAVEEAARGATRVVLDVGGVTFIDSVGLGMITRARDELADGHASALSMRNSSHRLSTLLGLTGLSAHFAIET